MPGSASAPRIIGRYAIKRLLGEGAFGKVYHAHDPQLDRDVAIKMLRAETLKSPQAVERFQREARAAAKMLHPRIVPVYDAGQHGKSQFIAQAYIEGSTLDCHIPERGMEPRRAVEIALQLLDALGYAHQMGILHRDVKPVNIMLAAGDQAYLMDFGLAKLVEGDAARLTQEGAVVGTPAYMAPEQALGNDAAIGPGTDLYSVGVVLYQLLTGRLPFEGPQISLMYNVVHTPAPAPTRFRPELDTFLSQVILKALAKEPAQRFATAEEFRQALKAWMNRQPTLPLAEDTLPIVQPGRPPTKRLPPAASKSESRPRWLPWLALILVCGVGVAIWVAWPGPKPLPTQPSLFAAATSTLPSAPTLPTAPEGEPTRPTESRSVPTRSTPVRSTPTANRLPTGTTVAQVEVPELRRLLLQAKLIRPYLEKQAPERLTYWRERAEGGDADAQWVLGLYLYTDRDEKTVAESFPWFEKAAAQGHEFATYYVYLCHLNGTGTRESSSQALSWLRRAVDRGGFQAQNAFALRFWNGTDGDTDRKSAMVWWEKAAAQDFVVAKTNWAIGFLLGGREVTQDPRRAVALLQQAVGVGYANAQYELAMCYRDGTGGLKVDLPEAFSLAERAAKQGHPEAMALCGDLLLKEEGKPEKEKEAVNWYQKSADAGSADGFHGLGFCWQRGLGVEGKDPKKAVGYFREAIRRNKYHNRALYELGRCYELALGVNEDLEMAEDYYRRAAEGGHVLAKRRLERMKER